MHRTLALAALALLAGCRDAAPKAPPTDDATYARLAALGGDALVVGLVDPRQWSAVRARVAQLSPPIASALPEAPRAAAQALGLTAEEAAAWDPERPIVVSAFEGSALVAPGGVGADLPLQAPTGARHQAVIPATDPAALAAGLRRLARLHGDGEGDAVRLQAPGQPRLRFLPEDGAVRVVAEVGTPGPARPAPAAPTPALRALADGRPAVGALLRPGLLNDVMTRHSLSQVAEALEYAPPEFRDRLLARGLAEVVLGNLLMAAASPDVEDVSLALAVEGEALSLLGVASLTPAGAARLQKGTASAGRRLAPKPGLFAWASVAFDLAAAVADAPTLPYATADELARGVMGCGVGCTLALPLRMPFTLARALVDAGPVPRADLPRAWQVAVGSGGPRPLALAVDVAAGFDPAPLKLPPAALERVARGDRATLLLSMDLAARDAFDLEATAPDDRLGEVTLARLPGWLPLPGALGRRVTLSGRVDGAALLARLQLAPADAAPTPLAAPAAQAWTPATPPTSPGAACLAKVARGFADALMAISEEKQPGPDDDASLACALADPVTAPAARGFAAQRAALRAAPPAPAAPATEAPPAQAPEAPPPPPPAAAATSSFLRPMSSLQASVRQQMPRLRACYERSLLTNPDLKARLRLTLSVSAAGRVEAAVVSGEGADALKPCLVEAARTFVLPAGEPRQVQVPLVFQTAH